MIRNILAERNDARAVVGGVAGMLVMAGFAYLVVPAAGLPRLDFGSWIGTLFMPVGTTALVIGLVIALLAGIIWAFVYEVAAREVADRGIVAEPAWLGGAVWGVVAWILAGIILGLAPRFHPQVVTGRIADVGFFGLASGSWTVPVGIFLAFLIYGVVLGLVEEAFGARPQRVSRAATA